MQFSHAADQVLTSFFVNFNLYRRIFPANFAQDFNQLRQISLFFWFNGLSDNRLEDMLQLLKRMVWLQSHSFSGKAHYSGDSQDVSCRDEFNNFRPYAIVDIHILDSLFLLSIVKIHFHPAAQRATE